MILHPDAAEIRRFWNLVSRPGEIRELRALKVPRRGTVSGYFDSVDPLIKAVTTLNGVVPGIYISTAPLTASRAREVP
jgi:hypothetical protein